MSDVQKFRKSINGFNCHDVVTYIEYLNNKHRSQINQLNNQLQAALAQPKVDVQAYEEQIAALQQQCADQAACIEQLTAQCNTYAQQLQDLTNECLAYKAQSSAAAAAPTPPTNTAPTCTEQELEAYRRAERVERLALERARQTKQQATGVLADATTQVQVAAAQLEDAAKTIAAQLDVYKPTVVGAGSILSDAAATLGTIAPEAE